MVVGCSLRENANGEYVVDQKETEERMRKIFSETLKEEREILEEEEDELRKLLGE